MSAHTAIEWAYGTYNLWWGCTQLSTADHNPGACDHCYAMTQAHHAIPPGWTIVGEGLATPRTTSIGDPNRPEIWGPRAPRIFPAFDGDYMRQPLAWSRSAARAGERRRYFVMSMGDWAERHSLDEVNREMDRRRAYFFDRIVPGSPNLDFLMLTKRPQDIMRLVPSAWESAWPVNVWVGTTVEDQRRAEQRIPHLVRIPAPIRFLSCEPLLGPLDLRSWISDVDWVICGGESGAQARPAQLAWVRSLRDQVVHAEKAFFFKQWGQHHQPRGRGDRLVRIRTQHERRLDGREWNQVPVPDHQRGVERVPRLSVWDRLRNPDVGRS